MGSFPKTRLKKQFQGFEEGPVQEWVDAIKDNSLPGSHFGYAAELTEMALVGVLAQRFAAKIEYDSENMKITNRPDIDASLKSQQERVGLMEKIFKYRFM